MEYSKSNLRKMADVLRKMALCGIGEVDDTRKTQTVPEMAACMNVMRDRNGLPFFFELRKAVMAVFRWPRLAVRQKG